LFLDTEQSCSNSNIYSVFVNLQNASHRGTRAALEDDMTTRTTTPTRPYTILRVDSSGRHGGSVTRALTGAVVDTLEARHAGARVIERDVAPGLPVVNETWIEANFTAPEQRDDRHKARLAGSDALVAELQAADAIVIGVPIYNFGVPAALKAWIDQVARARLTFRYTEKGPEGLLRGKKAWLVVASGGVPVDSALDFATPYMRHVLGFLGIHEVEVIEAGRLNFTGKAAVESAHEQVRTLVAANDATTAHAVA